MRWLLSGGIVGLLCVAAGLYTLTARRPVVLAVRWAMVLAILAAFVCSILMGGYAILGATEEQLDAAMADALDRLQQPFERTSEGMRLTAQDATLRVRMGVQDAWNVSVSPRARRRVLVAVAGGMRAYFASRNERGSRSGSYAWLVAGGVILLLQLFETILRRR